MSNVPRRVDGGELVVEDDQHGWGGHSPSDGAAVEVLPGWGEGGGMIYSTKTLTPKIKSPPRVECDQCTLLR